MIKAENIDPAQPKAKGSENGIHQNYFNRRYGSWLGTNGDWRRKSKEAAAIAA
ncbi:hypothetical protein [Marinobacter sp. es.048]|uniref:hypothetical protein n=1 Tax=Marinobacter sp. es.048 TaxID=1761795 RepID=UPI001E41ECD6|nr:hypothetical protein [Marinobacter sp. es.048]